MLSFKFSNVFKKIASSPVQFVWCRDKQIQSFSKPPKTLNLHAYVYFGFKITRHLCRDQKNGISVNGMRRDVCNSGDVIGRGGFKRSSRAPTFRGLWYAKIRQQRMHKSSSRELESEKKRERGEEKGNGKEKKEIRKEARIEIARDNELSGSARFRAKIQWLNRVIKSRRRLTTTSRRLPFVRYPTQLSSVLLFASSVINREWLYN